MLFFSELGELDRFTIENGTVTDINAATLSGVTIRRNTTVSPSYPRKHGELRLLYLKYNNTLDTALLTGQSSMYSLVIRVRKHIKWGKALHALIAQIVAISKCISHLQKSGSL